MKKIPARRKYSSSSKTGITRSARKNIRNAVVVVVVFVFSFLLLFSYTFYKYLNQRFASALSSTSYAIADEPIPTISYIVAEDLKSDPVVIKKVEFFILNKDTNRVFAFNVPVDKNYEIPGRFGSETLDKVFALGELNAQDKYVSGAEAINRSIFKLFGFKVDKFIVTDTKYDDFFDKLWRGGGILKMMKMKDVASLNDHLKTDMDIREFYNLTSFISSLPKENILEKNIVPESFSNTDNFDNFIRESTLDSVLSKEKKSVSVLNGTNYSGLASFGSRVVNNFGGRVVATQNTTKTYDKSVIVTDDNASETVLFLSRVFRISNIISKAEARSHSIMENEVDRSDVVVILGFDTSGDLY